MTTDNAIGSGRKCVPAILPWLVAAGALIVYLLTLNKWVTISSLPHVVRVAGWDWQPDMFAPLHFLVTYPFRWLPSAWVPVALNLFAAVCGALTLALLARSVALLPHDRTREQRHLEDSEFSLLSTPTAWIPPLLAVFACGLQMTFWENATAASSEMLDLLLFAYVIRCLLEYRVDPGQSWLVRASLIYGAGMANNWAMVGFLPLFLFALVRINGWDFFNLRFLLRMALCGLAGMSFYVLLPLTHSLSEDPQASFGQALWFVLVSHKNILLALFRQFYGPNKDVAVLLCLTSFLPLLALSIRWRSTSGDISHFGIALTKFVFRVVHGIFFVACLWVAFDPLFSPRQSWRQLGFTLPFLTLYYLSALSVGYFSGYFLLLFGGKARHLHSRENLSSRLPYYVIPPAVCVLLVGTPAMLVYRNLPHIQSNNGPLLSQYAALATRGLPASGAVVLSDDPVRLFLVQAELTRSKVASNYLLLDTQSLTSPRYHRFLSKKHPGRWNVPAAVSESIERPDSATLIGVMTQVAKSNSVYYLHPSFGYYFEQFYSEPHGLVYGLKFYPGDTIEAPLLTPELIRENEEFWKQVQTSVVEPIAALLSRPEEPQSTDLVHRFMEWVRVKEETDAHAAIVGSFCSRALNYWGVQLQKCGRLGDAARCFAQAKQLNPNNVVAQINADFNENLQAGRKASFNLSKSVEDQFGKYRNWNQVIGQNGPFDEPSFCHEWGRVFVKAGLFCQAAQEFSRAKTLAPDNLAVRLSLAQLFNLWQKPDKVLATVAETRGEPQLLPLNQTNRIELICLEASAHFAKTNYETAEQILEGALAQYPTDENLINAAAQIYTAYGRYSNALAAVQSLVRLKPDILPDRLWQAQLYNLCQMPDMVLATITEIRSQPKRLPLSQTSQVELVCLEAMAHFAKTNTQTAKDTLELALSQYPSDGSLLSAATQIYLAHGCHSNALAVVEKQSRLTPDDMSALANKGYLCLQLNAFADAISPLSRVLAVQPNNYLARLNRAIAYLQSGNLNAAQADYQTLHKVSPTTYQILYGLGEIAYRKKDTNSAINFYQLYLSNSIPNSEEGKLVSARLAELKAGAR